MAKQTSFRRWREQLGFTQDEAAEALGISRSQVANLDAGRDRATGKPALPGLALRTLMTAIAMDEVPQPWPE